jgi:hypothetical protein
MKSIALKSSIVTAFAIITLSLILSGFTVSALKPPFKPMQPRWNAVDAANNVIRNSPPAWDAVDAAGNLVGSPLQWSITQGYFDAMSALTGTNTIETRWGSDPVYTVRSGLDSFVNFYNWVSENASTGSPFEAEAQRIREQRATESWNTLQASSMQIYTALLDGQTAVRITDRFRVPPMQGPMPYWSMPYIPVIMNIADLREELYRRGQAINDMEELLQQLQGTAPTDSPLLVGQCAVTRLPVLQRAWQGDSGGVLNHNYIGSIRYNAYRRHAVPSFTHPNGNVYTYGIVETNRIVVMRNGEVVPGQNMARIAGSYFPIGFISYLNEASNTITVHFVILSMYRTNWHLIISLNIGSSIQPLAVINTDIVSTTGNEWPTISRSREHRPSVIEPLIRTIAEIDDEEDGRVGVRIPIISPDHFPSIPAEHFPDFVNEILEHLELEDIIMTGQELRDINLNLPVIELNPNIIIQPRPPDLTGIVAGIRDMTGLLQQQLIVQRNINRELERFFAEPASPYMPYLPDSSGLFDFRINLMDYFPFSIPRDLVDLISILLGQTPAAFMGATDLEIAVFNHYQETGEITEAGFALIEPMLLTQVAPRIEIDIPLPNFSGGRIDNDGSTVAYTFVLDFSDYPTFIAIIHFATFIAVIIGLIRITPMILTW